MKRESAKVRSLATRGVSIYATPRVCAAKIGATTTVRTGPGASRNSEHDAQMEMMSHHGKWEGLYATMCDIIEGIGLRASGDEGMGTRTLGKKRGHLYVPL